MSRATCAVLAGALLVMSLVVGYAGAQPSRTAFRAYVCGVGAGATWTRSGRTGNDWLVSALDDKNQCKSARQWLLTLSARLSGRAGADTQAFRSNGYACVMTRSQFLAACRTGNGGPGTVGIAVIGDPTRNPVARAYAAGRTTFPPLPSPTSAGGPGPTADGIPIPWDHGVDCHLSTVAAGPAWSFRLSDGKLIDGDTWTVRGARGADEVSCQAVRDLWPRLAAAAGSARARSDAFSATSWRDGAWSCVASHDMSRPGGASSISSPPTAGCAKVNFPGGGDHGILEQVAVFPRVESTRTPITVAEQAPLYERMRDVRNAIDRYGIHAVTVLAATAERLDAPPPDGQRSDGTAPWSSNGVIVCGTTYSEHFPSFRLIGSQWRHGSERGSNWQVGTSAGYPCDLAKTLFLPFLAERLEATGSVPGGQLNRYGWACSLDRPALIGVCRFTGSGDPLAAAVGRPLPTGMVVGVRAAFMTGATTETLRNAIDAAR